MEVAILSYSFVGGLTDLLVSAIALLYFFGVWRPALINRFRGNEKLAIRLSAIIAALFLFRGTWRLVEVFSVGV